jgi:hypothetical protein
MQLPELRAAAKKVNSKGIGGKAKIDLTIDSPRKLRQAITDYLNKFAQREEDEDDEEDDEEEPAKAAPKRSAKKPVVEEDDDEDEEEPKPKKGKAPAKAAKAMISLDEAIAALKSLVGEVTIEPEEEDDEDEDEDEPQERPDWIRVGAKVECDVGEDDEEVWEAGAIEDIDDDAETCTVAMDDGEGCEAPWSAMRALSRRPKKRG